MSDSKAHTHIRIASRGESFRRAGKAFSRQGSEHPISDFSEAQIAELRAERALTIVEFTPDPSAPVAPAPVAKKKAK